MPAPPPAGDAAGSTDEGVVEVNAGTEAVDATGKEEDEVGVREGKVNGEGCDLGGLVRVFWQSLFAKLASLTLAAIVSGVIALVINGGKSSDSEEDPRSPLPSPPSSSSGYGYGTPIAKPVNSLT